MKQTVSQIIKVTVLNIAATDGVAAAMIRIETPMLKQPEIVSLKVGCSFAIEGDFDLETL